MEHDYDPWDDELAEREADARMDEQDKLIAAHAQSLELYADQSSEFDDYYDAAKKDGEFK